MLNELQYLLQDIKTEQPGPGDDAALACLVSSQDEVGRSQHLGLSQPGFGFLVAGEKWGNRGRQAAFCSENHKSGTDCAPALSSLLYLLNYSVNQLLHHIKWNLKTCFYVDFTQHLFL